MLHGDRSISSLFRALFALSVDMIWGYTGLLSLGQGLYFGMGAYIAAWSLKLQMAAVKAADPTMFPDPILREMFGVEYFTRVLPERELDTSLLDE